MTFQGVGRLLLILLKLVLWGFFCFAIFRSFDKLMKGKLGFAISTQENGFEMPSMTICVMKSTLDSPKTFEELNETRAKVKGQKLLNASIMVKKLYTDNGQ